MLLSAPASADVLEFTDKDEWIKAVGQFATIGFTGFPEGTWITDQYADVGILFTDGDDWIHHTCGFVNDCWGLAGGDGNDQITVAFDTPQLWIGVDYPGALKIELFSEGRLIYTSSNFGVGGAGNFAGLLSTDLFDGAVLSDWVDGTVFIDDLHFVPPGPGKCPSDLDGTDVVGEADLLSLLVQWGTDPGGPPDFDGAFDLLALLVNWRPFP